MKPRHCVALVAGSMGLVLFGIITFAARRIERSSAVAVKADMATLPHKHVGLVLGCSSVLQSGAPNLYFERRIAAAAALFRAQKVDYLLVSGDNHISTYDEPTAMQRALVRAGVPEGRIVLDYAGFSTLDSVVRAREVFGLSDFCVITQREHALRAIYIAKANGIEVVAFPAQDVPRVSGLRTALRESLARVRTLLDVHLLGRKPRFLGPKIEIGTTSTSRRSATSRRGPFRI